MRSVGHGNRRVLSVDVGRVDQAAGVAFAWTDEDPALAEISGWGGTALGLAILARGARSDPAASTPLILTVGSAVGRGLPTAARASVLSRAPLTGRLSEGQIGGALGVVLASHADALVLSGRTERPGAVLVLRKNRTLALESYPELQGADPVATWRFLGAQRPELEPAAWAMLSVGIAGENQVPFASLAGAGERPSFVGRGGLGAVLGRLGLKAVVVEAAPAAGESEEPGSTERGDLLRALSNSPRLAARSTHGTFELYGAFAARGDLRANNYTEPLDPTRGGELLAEARASATERHGCRGCPTPCGWVFERSDGTKQTAHFSASYALGTNVGLERFEDSLVLLEVCDRLGLDAKEAGSVLALACRAGELPWGDRGALLARLESLASGDPEDPGCGGALCFARARGLEAELAEVGGQSARPESNHAAVLGQCVTPGGSDPMRSFPFLIDAAGRAGLERVCGDLGPLPALAEDPESPNGKGRLVFWHENLVSAVDMTGFCAFSTAGLLSDDLCALDRLAAWILPPALDAPQDPAWAALEPGRRLLAAGANLVLLRRELLRCWGAMDEFGRSSFATERLSEPGMLDEYRHWRGLDEHGHVQPRRLACLGSPRVLPASVEAGSEASDQRGSAGERPTPSPAGAQRPGRAELRSLGSQAGTRVVETLLPTTLEELLAQSGLVPSQGAAPAVWRAGRRVAPGELVCDGDVLDLVSVISGG